MFPESLCVNVYIAVRIQENTVACTLRQHSTAQHTASVILSYTLAHALDKNRLEPDTCHHFFSSSSSFVYFWRDFFVLLLLIASVSACVCV